MSTAHSVRLSLQRRDRILLLAGVVLLAVLYLPVLINLVRQWLNDPNYRHGIIIPIVSAFLIWRRRDELKAVRGNSGTAPGIILLAVAAALLIGGTAASELFTTRISLPIFLIGVSFFLLGKTFTKKISFPLLFLFVMVPLPYLIYYKLTFPLQLFSARLSAGVLDLLRINVIRKGNIIHLPNYSLEVIAACSGLRSLMTMLTLALILAALSKLSNLRKVILVAWAVPAAVAANVIRLVVTATGAHAIGSSFADGVLHNISGLIVFLAGFIILMLFAWLLKWIK